MRKIFYGASLIVALATLVAVNAGSKVATNMGPEPMGIQILNSTTL